MVNPNPFFLIFPEKIIVDMLKINNIHSFSGQVNINVYMPESFS